MRKITWMLLFISLGSIALAQADSVGKPIKSDQRLRVRMYLFDTTSHSCPCDRYSAEKLYVFEIDTVYEGDYKRKFIGVCAPEADILQFNPLKETGKDYWWVLRRECFVLDELPVYLLSGKF